MLEILLVTLAAQTDTNTDWPGAVMVIGVVLANAAMVIAALYFTRRQ